MDNFKQYKAPRGTSRAIDGFSGGALSGVSRQSTPTANQAGMIRQPRIDNFASSEGFRPANQPVVVDGSGRARSVPDGGELSRPVPLSGLDDIQNGNKRARKRRSPLKIFARTAIVLVLIVLMGGGYFAGRTFFALHGVLKGGGSAPALAKTLDVSQLKGEGDGRVNILLLGVGGQGHDGPDLTDTMMVASIDPINKKAGLMSIPRDLWVKMPNNYIANEQKINAAYESGKYNFLGKQDASNSNRESVNAGFKAADGVVEQVLGIPIHYNVLVDFHAFAQAIDTVGGVSVNVPTALIDPTMAWENNGSATLAKAGEQTMGGAQALRYVRSRETSSDFARSERQRAVIVALKDKAMSIGTLTNPVKIASLISAFGDNVVSDISTGDAVRLAEIAKDIANDQIQSVALTDAKANLVTTAALNGLSVVRPTAGAYDYTAIQAYARNMLKDGYIQNENANIAVLNGSKTAGLAGKKAQDLRSYGYTVTTVANAPTQTYTDTILVDLTNGKKRVTAKYLQERYGVTPVTTLPDPAISASGADFVIILGQNDKSS